MHKTSKQQDLENYLMQICVNKERIYISDIEIIHYYLRDALKYGRPLRTEIERCLCEMYDKSLFDYDYDEYWFIRKSA